MTGTFRSGNELTLGQLDSWSSGIEQEAGRNARGRAASKVRGFQWKAASA